MGIDGSEYSVRGKRGVGVRGHICRAGFLCETALRDFRFGDAIENGTRQSRAPLRAVARTRAPAERPVFLDDQSPTLRAVHLPKAGQKNASRSFKTLTTPTADFRIQRTVADEQSSRYHACC